MIELFKQIEWSNALLIVIGGAFILGGLLVWLIGALYRSKLQTSYAYVQQALARKADEYDVLMIEAKALEASHHQLQMIENRLRGDFENANAMIQHVNNECNKILTTNSELLEEIKVTEERAHISEKSLERAMANLQSAKEIVDDLRQRLHVFEERVGHKDYDIQLLTEKNQVLALEVTKTNTHTEEQASYFKSQLQHLQENKETLTKAFENLAHKIFEEKGKVFQERNQINLETLLKPFREQIEGFQKRVNEVHDESIKGNTHLNAEIRKVLEVGMTMSEEANNLASALKGDSQKRGAWGEAQLQRTLEMSGLMKDAHFEMQTNFKDDDGKQKITDFLINLPDGKHIVIDSKVSLNAYARLISAEDDVALARAIKEHIAAVKRHIDELSYKDYSNLSGIHSPNFVLMFMPIEAAYIEVLKQQADLFDYGYQKNVILVSHTTLMPILRTISNLWMIERSTTEAREISERAGDIYNQVVVIAERLQKLGGSITAASNHYNSAITALVGQQGLYGKVERFNQLSAKALKVMPDVEKIYPDIQSDRIDLNE